MVEWIATFVAAGVMAGVLYLARRAAWEQAGRLALEREVRLAQAAAREAEGRAGALLARVQELRAQLEDWRRFCREARDEAAQLTEVLVSLKRDHHFTLAPPRPEAEEPWPREVTELLASYPPELRAPTERWVRQQRAVRVDWPVIARHLNGGRDPEQESV